MESDNGQPVTDQQIAEVRNKAMQISGFIDPDNDPTKMWQERPYLDGASKDPSVRVIQNGLVNRNDAAKKIADLRAHDRRPDGITVSVGGTPALEQDSIHSLFDKLPLMVVLLITTTTILMFLAFGSVVLPIKAAVMSALTLGSTMGVLTWMFVDGHGSGLMNYTPQPLMAPMIGLIIAVIWGLSTDYEVFLVSRMVEARERGMSTAEAIRIGTATTGRLITGAALVLAVVAGAFVFSDLVMMKYLAFGLLIALLLDATVVRMFLVPADDEAARRRLLVGAAVDEAAPGTPWPWRDRAAGRAQASRRARARRKRWSVRADRRRGRGRRTTRPIRPRGLVTAGCRDDADRDPAAGRHAVRCGHDADSHGAYAVRRATDHAAFDGEERHAQCREQCDRRVNHPPAATLSGPPGRRHLRRRRRGGPRNRVVAGRIARHRARGRAAGTTPLAWAHREPGSGGHLRARRRTPLGRCPTWGDPPLARAASGSLARNRTTSRRRRFPHWGAHPRKQGAHPMAADVRGRRTPTRRLPSPTPAESRTPRRRPRSSTPGKRKKSPSAAVAGERAGSAAPRRSALVLSRSRRRR